MPPLPALTRAALAGFPVAVAAVTGVGGGRGLVATRSVAAGEVVLSEKPLVATPAAGASVCAACLAPVATAPAAPSTLPHCSPACASETAATGWTAAFAASHGFSELATFTSPSSARFPWLAARSASRHVAATLGLPGVDVPAATDTGAALAALARASADSLPPAWRDSHAAFTAGAARWLTATSQSGGASMSPSDAVAALGALVPEDGWGALLGAARVNAVRVDVPPTAAALNHTSSFSAALDALATACVTGDAAGSALYAGGSLCNHACAPSAAPAPRGDAPAMLTLVATRELAPFEAITISYIDHEAPVHARRAALADYGFVCECERCVAESVESER